MGEQKYKPGDKPNPFDTSITDEEYARREDLARRTDKVDRETDPEGFVKMQKLAGEKREAEERADVRDAKRGRKEIVTLLGKYKRDYVLDDPNATVGELKNGVNNHLNDINASWDKLNHKIMHEEPPAQERASLNREFEILNRQRVDVQRFSKLLEKYALDDQDTIADYEERLKQQIGFDEEVKS